MLHLLSKCHNGEIKYCNYSGEHSFFRLLSYFLFRTEESLMAKVNFLPENSFSNDKYILNLFDAVDHLCPIVLHDGEPAAFELEFSALSGLFPLWKDMSHVCSNRWYGAVISPKQGTRMLEPQLVLSSPTMSFGSYLLSTKL